MNVLYLIEFIYEIPQILYFFILAEYQQERAGNSLTSGERPYECFDRPIS